MRLITIVSVVAIFGGAFSNSTMAEDSTASVSSLLEKSDYETLDNQAAEYRQQSLGASDYDCDLERYYRSFPQPRTDASDGEWDRYKTELDDWVKKNPDSIAAQIALGRYYLALAWKARGSGWAKEVPVAQWQSFYDAIKESKQHLQLAEAIGGRIKQNDPEIYTSLLVAALGDRDAQDKGKSYFETGISKQRFYYPLYRARAHILMQRWYGKRGDAERFADEEASKLQGDEADAMYTMIAEEIFLTEGTKFFEVTTFSWTRLKRGLVVIAGNAKTPSRQKRSLNELLYLACVVHDYDTASDLLLNFRDENWDSNFWGAGMDLEKLKSFVSTAKKEE